MTLLVLEEYSLLQGKTKRSSHKQFQASVGIVYDQNFVQAGCMSIRG